MDLETPLIFTVPAVPPDAAAEGAGPPKVVDHCGYGIRFVIVAPEAAPADADTSVLTETVLAAAGGLVGRRMEAVATSRLLTAATIATLAAGSRARRWFATYEFPRLTSNPEATS